jgi:EAL domain-containing protein (putative c-di-GMP-specific phosphodiesterase class I)
MDVSARQIERGLAAGEFLFHYQPKMSFASGRVSGAEALLRWQRGGDLLLPETFIPEATRAGMLPEITRRMLPRMLSDFQEVRSAYGETTIALNVTAQDLDTPSVIGLLADAVEGGAISSRRLEVEITETAAVSGSDVTRRSLAALMKVGVQLAMDDYGTGFSSLDSLHRLPFSTIKMDQSFVLQMLRSAKSMTLVKASIAMAQMLGIKTVIEGIESESVYNSLLHCGCSEGQGYWISPPLAPEAFLAFLKSGAAVPGSPVGMLRMAQLSHTWQKSLLMDEVFAYLRSASTGELNLQGLHTAHDRCALGAWIYGEGQSFAGDRDFDALEVPHRAMHQACEEIFAGIHQDSGARRMNRLLDELTEYSNRVVASLQRLETRLLIGELAQPPAKLN